MGMINSQHTSYSTDDWIYVKTYNPDTSFGPMPVEMARSYVRTRGGEAGGFFMVPDPDAAKRRDPIWDAIRDAASLP